MRLSDRGPEYYTIQSPGADDERRILQAIPAIGDLPDGVKAQAVTAWHTVWRSSSHARLDQLPYSLDAPSYSLVQHTMDVVSAGRVLERFASDRWGCAVDSSQLLATLILHDVDKPLLYSWQDGKITLSAAGRDIPHGVLGGMLLQQLGVDPAVVGPVATHAVYSPWHGTSVIAWLLHYADFFCADHVMRAEGQRPFYQPKPHV